MTGPQPSDATELETPHFQDIVAFLRTLASYPDQVVAAAAVEAADFITRLTRERDEALMVTEGASTLQDMAAGYLEGASWKARATRAEALLGEVVKGADDISQYTTLIGDHVIREVLLVKIRAFLSSLSNQHEASGT